MNNMKPLKVKVSLTLDEEIVEKLRAIAEEDDRADGSTDDYAGDEFGEEVCDVVLHVVHFFMVVTVSSIVLII